jgi:hypothetical protein
MEGASLRVPPVFGLLGRGYAIMVSVVCLHVVGYLQSRPAAIFLVSMTSIAMMFGVGHLLVAAKRPLKKAPMDIPSIVMIYAGGGLVMYFVSLMAERGIILDSTAFLLLASCSVAVSIVGIGSYLVEIASNVRCSLSKAPRRKPVRAR